MLSSAARLRALNSRPMRGFGARRSVQKVASTNAPRVRVEPHQYLAFYKYARLQDPQKATEDLRSRLEALGGLGRIYVGREGLNAQMSVPTVCFEAWRYSLARYCEKWGIGEVTMNIGGTASMETEDERPFSKLTVKLRERIVQDALPMIVDEKLDLSHLDDMALKPSQWHEKMRLISKSNSSVSSSDSQSTYTTSTFSTSDKQTSNNTSSSDTPIVVDCRNWYESQIGKFESAIRLPVDRHSEAFEAIDNILEHQPDDREVLIYCTGGIRCEKIGAYLRQIRGRKNVWTLQGGINRYAKYVESERQKALAQAGREEADVGQLSQTSGEISHKVAETSDVTSYFKGINYQFDKRNKYGLETERVTEDVLGRCDGCGVPSDFMHNCSNPLCNLLLVLCPSCYAKQHGTCSKECERIALLPVEERLKFERDHDHQLARQLASRSFSPLVPKDGASHQEIEKTHLPASSSKKPSKSWTDAIPLHAPPGASVHQKTTSLPFVRSKAYLKEVLREDSAMEYRKRILDHLSPPSNASDSPTVSSASPSIALKSDHGNASSTLDVDTSTARTDFTNDHGSSLLPLPPSNKGIHRLAQDHESRREGFSRITSPLVSEYVQRFSSPPSPLLHRDHGLNFEDLRSQISVGPYQGQFLMMVARMMGAKKVLEIGSYLGYSALCFAEAVASTLNFSSSIHSALESEGYVFSCDLDHVSLHRARENASKHPFGHLVSFYNESGLKMLKEAKESGKVFDLIFVDADKHNFVNYYSYIFQHRLLAPNGMLIVDNTLWRGEVVDADLDESQETSAEMSFLPTSPSAAVSPKERRRHHKEHTVHQFNKFVQEDVRTKHVILPIRDGMTFISWAPSHAHSASPPSDVL